MKKHTFKTKRGTKATKKSLTVTDFKANFFFWLASS